VEDIEKDFPKSSSFIRKMLIKHQENIINFFSDGLTNSKAENLNGKIQRFVANNYGLRNRDFSTTDSKSTLPSTLKYDLAQLTQICRVLKIFL
jgi:hypothetical protein